MIFIDNHRVDSTVGVEATMSHQLRGENCVEGQLEMDKPVEKWSFIHHLPNKDVEHQQQTWHSGIAVVDVVHLCSNIDSFQEI